MILSMAQFNLVGMGAVFFFLLLPIIPAIIGIILALFYFVAACLFLIGISGIIMNKLYKKQTMSTECVAAPWCNVGSIIVSVVIFLLPLGIALFAVMSALFGMYGTH